MHVLLFLFSKLTKSDNSIVRLCSQIALQGSGSNVSNNLSVVAATTGTERNHLISVNVALMLDEISDEADVRRSSLIKDLLDERHMLRIMHSIHSPLTAAKADALLYNACTDLEV